MSFNYGDVVRNGNGKVTYLVVDAADLPADYTAVESSNTGKVSKLPTEKLKLVTPVEETDAGIAANLNMALEDDVEEHFAAMDELETAEASTFAESFDTAVTGAMAEIGNTAGRENPMAPWEVELMAPLHIGPWLLTVDHVTTGHKSFSAAADALVLAKRAGFKHYAVIDHNGQRKVTRIAA